MASQRQETVSALVDKLADFRLPKNAVLSYLTGDDLGALIPPVQQVIKAQGLNVFTFDEAIKHLLGLGRIDTMRLALQLLATQGLAAGATALSVTEDLQSFVFFDYDTLPVNQQLLVSVHETAHVLTPMDVLRRIGPVGGANILCGQVDEVQRINEAIAYATQFCVMEYLEKETLDQTLIGLALYKVTPEHILPHAELICQNAETIIQAIAATR